MEIRHFRHRLKSDANAVSVSRAKPTHLGNVLRTLATPEPAASAYRESHNEYPSAHHIASLLDAGRYDTDQRE